MACPAWHAAMAQAPVAIAKWALVIAMWWTMMVAMMTPSAAPTILLYARVHRHAVAQGQAGQQLAPPAAFAVGYLLVWLGFSDRRRGAARGAGTRRPLSAMMMGSQSRWLSAGVLIAAGLYQLSPLKHACLAHCRAPAAFLARHWRPGASGALRLGVMHGAYCVGCCWVLMVLLFVGGVMNLVWIAGLAVSCWSRRCCRRANGWAAPPASYLSAWGVATFLI